MSSTSSWAARPPDQGGCAACRGGIRFVLQGTEGETEGYYYTGIGDQGPVTAGGWVNVVQAGEGNQVVLGNEDSSLDTYFLDVYTGDGGGGFVQATNTSVFWGSFLGNDFTVDGGGDGNVLYDAGGNSGVTGSDNYDTV